MSRKHVTHSEEWWATKVPPGVVRCTAHYKTGEPCRREAMAGGSVCGEHGGLAPAALAAARTRLATSSDDAAALLVAAMHDENNEMRDRLRAIEAVLDRSGIGKTDRLLVGSTADDPVEKLFRSILGDPGALTAPPDRPEQDAREAEWNAAALAEADDDVVIGEVVASDRPALPEPEVEAVDSRMPAHLRRDLDMLK